MNHLSESFQATIEASTLGFKQDLRYFQQTDTLSLVLFNSILSDDDSVPSTVDIQNIHLETID